MGCYFHPQKRQKKYIIPCIYDNQQNKNMIDATVYFLQRCIDEERQYKPILMNKEEIIIIPHSLANETKYFSDEVEVLKKAFPELAKAMQEDLPYTLELTLQEISKLFPGRRVRLDAYKRLIRYLATQHITLLLTSRKSKK